MGFAKRKVSSILSFVLLFYFHLLLLQYSDATNIITSTQSIIDGETLSSHSEIFELGFFSPGKSSNRYVGIWYKNISNILVVWVANREKPLKDSSGLLQIGDDGNLVLLDGTKNIVWSTNVFVPSSNSTAVLSDGGNLMLKNVHAKGYLWKSFDYPTDTFLEGMKLGLDGETGETYYLTAWKSEDDPSPGNFTLSRDNQQVVQGFIFNGSKKYWRTGQWSGNFFTGIPDTKSTYLSGWHYERNYMGGGFLTFSSPNQSVATMLVLGSSGNLTHFNRYKDGNNNILSEIWKAPQSQCDIYGMCGPFGACNDNESPICRCLKGFKPKFKEEWSKGIWNNGCMRKTQLQCHSNQTGFHSLEAVKLPDFSENLVDFDSVECKAECLKNCSCVAYAYVDSLCLNWVGDLIDIRDLSGGTELFLRLANSELDKKRQTKLFSIFLPIVGLIVLGTIVFIFYRVKAKREAIKNYGESPHGNLLKDGMKEIEGPTVQLFDYDSIAIATNNFNITNKLGEGGFGPVYKGELLDGQRVAVKRLSRSSGQGVEEFKNEVTLISRLQHMNLVRLLGYCFDGEEKMLLYEYMPNGSLDVYLFDPAKRCLLTWAKRFNIVDGIARGLLYLHRDSRLRVIHRDLKASNILLDEDMNPKISDFGMARIFGGKQIQANTNRIVGTYGYMSPEYAMEGVFSEKSDVFSFGVLLLEIVSSKRNTSFRDHKQILNLLGYAWQLWNEGKAMELLDTIMANSFSPSQLMRCIHVGLLCVQEHPINRPTMSSVVFMLGSGSTLPTPKKPGFTVERRYMGSDSSRGYDVISINDATITSIEGR